MQASFVKARKAWFDKVPKALFGDNVDKGYDCFIDILLNFEEALKSLKHKNFD